MPIPDVSARSIAELISLAGRNAVITGGARGIGLAIGMRFAEAGAGVLLGDLDLAEAQAAAGRIAERGGRAIAGPLDVRDSDSVRTLADQAVRELGSLDIWVNNAGIYPEQTILEMTDDEWDRVLDINLRGAFVGAREAARRMVERGRGGTIITIASTSAYTAGGDDSHYVVSKHGLLGLNKSIAVEFGASNIRALALSPTLIATPGTQAIRGLDLQSPTVAARLPLGRIGVPDDVARVALFCASDLSMLMTGSALLVDAGEMAR